jgi:hypothetical protein
MSVLEKKTEQTRSALVWNQSAIRAKHPLHFVVGFTSDVGPPAPPDTDEDKPDHEYVNHGRQSAPAKHCMRNCMAVIL